MLDEFHLPGGEDALGGFVAKLFECREEATGEAQFLSEGTDGSLVFTVGKVEHEMKHDAVATIHPHHVFIRRPSCEAAIGHRVKDSAGSFEKSV